MTKMCATCRFWREEGNGHLGPCLRYPPAADVQCTGRWPTTHRSNWCGEHQPREPEAEQPKALEPGWYWVNHAEPSDLGPWIAQWHGDAWWLGNVCVPDFVGEVLSPRLEPPT